MVYSSSSTKKRKSTNSLSQSNGSRKKSRKSQGEEAVLNSNDMAYQAWLAPHNHEPTDSQVAKGFDQIAQGQALVSQMQDFYKNGTSDYTTKVVIEQGDHWNAMDRFVRANWKNVKFAVGDDVLVKQDKTNDNGNPHMADLIKGYWVGRILEIRGKRKTPGAKVHVLMNWYSRPEDLPDLGKGLKREPYHGMNELIASNDIQIEDATTLESHVKVEFWDDSVESEPTPDTLFCRQAVDVRSKVFSSLTRICVCKKPRNPDKMVLYCGDCDLWLHDECLISALAERESVPKKRWERAIIDEEAETLPNEFVFKPSKGSSWTVAINDKEGIFVSEDKEADRWESKIECLQCKRWLH